LNKSSLAVRSHKCRLQRIGFTTTREQCPFCKEAIHPDSHDVDTEAGASAVAPADGTVAAEAAVPLTSAESASQLAAGNGHTPDVAHEADSETTPDEDDTTAPVSSPIGASRLRDRLLFLKQKKVTLGSAAILIPLLLYPFQEPIKGWVRAWVTNSRPVIDGIEAGKTIYAGGSIQLTGMARDANGDKLTYTWKGPSEGKIEGDGKTVLLNLADSVAQPGEVLKVTLVVSDQDVSSEPYTKEIHVVPVPSNHDPELSPITAVPAQVTAGKSVKLSTGATDPDGDAPTYEWSCSSGWFEGNNINSATVVLNTTGVTVLPSTSMNIKVTATVRDRRGGHDTKTIDVSVVAPREAASPSPTPQSAPPNDAPQVVIAPPDRLTIIAGESLRLLANATDQSGDELKYEWHVGNTNARIDGDGPDVTLNTSGLKALTVPLRVSITLIVKNWHGGKSLPAQIYIEVRPPEPASVGPVPSAHPEPNASVSPTPSPSPEAKPSGR
jgi:acyl-CoA hydrolase